MELTQVVAAAVRSRRAELELLVREQVDAELARLVPELVEAELHARRNGGTPALPAADTPEEVSTAPGDPSRDRDLAAPDARAPEEQEPPPATKVCRVCGETKPLAKFPPGRNTCRACKRSRERERGQRAKAADKEPAPAPRRAKGGLRALRSVADRAAAEERRELLAELRANGVEHVESDGRTFTVLRLPGPEPRAATTRTPIVRHAPAGAVQRVG